MQKHAETLANDILCYVALAHGKIALEALESKAEVLTDCIVAALKLSPPGRVMNWEYRSNFVQAYADSFHNTL